MKLYSKIGFSDLEIDIVRFKKKLLYFHLILRAKIMLSNLHNKNYSNRQEKHKYFRVLIVYYA